MNPLELILWALSISASIFLLSIAIAILVGTIRAIKRPKTAYKAPVTKLTLVQDKPEENIPPTP